MLMLIIVGAFPLPGGREFVISGGPGAGGGEFVVPRKKNYKSPGVGPGEDGNSWN